MSLGSCFRSWCGTEEGLCHLAFGPLLSGLQRAVMLQACMLLLSPSLCFAQAAFLFCLQDKQTLPKTATKNTRLYMVANQIVRRSGVGVDGWVLSLSVPMCSFSPYICWCDLQPMLVTKASPAALVKGLSKRQKLHPDQ